MNEVRWMSYREAARRVGRDVRTIQRWRAAGMPMRERHGGREVREDVLLGWFRDRLQAWPTHQYRMRRLRAAGELD